jgi:hypothetical protein
VSAVVIFAVIIGWVVYDQVAPKSSQSQSTTITLPESVTPFGPAIVNAQTIQAEVKNVGHVIYWAGAPVRQNLELTVLKNGTTYVRYLPQNVAAGIKKQYLTVVTFPDVNGYANVHSSAKRPGTISAADTGGAFVVASSKQSTNAYFAFKNYPIQVEVFTPTPGAAWELIQTGKISLVN